MVEVVSVLKTADVLGRQFAVYGTVENPLFLAKDVAEWIAYSDGNVAWMLKLVDEDEKYKVYCTLRKPIKPSQSNTYDTSITESGGANRWFLTEYGLYEVLMQSTLPIAKQFKKAVKGILKDIRKQGFYATQNTVENFLNDPDAAIKILTAYRDEKAENARLRQEVSNATRSIADLEEKITGLNNKIEEDSTAVNFVSAILNANTLITITDLSKILYQRGVNIGRTQLFKWLRDNGYICKKKGIPNAPTQKSMNLGLFRLISYVIQDSKEVIYTTKVTTKGQVYLVDKLIRYFTENLPF